MFLNLKVQGSYKPKIFGFKTQNNVSPFLNYFSFLEKMLCCLLVSMRKKTWLERCGSEKYMKTIFFKICFKYVFQKYLNNPPLTLFPCDFCHFSCLPLTVTLFTECSTLQLPIPFKPLLPNITMDSIMFIVLTSLSH